MSNHYTDNWAPEQAFDIATEAIDACIAVGYPLKPADGYEMNPNPASIIKTQAAKIQKLEALIEENIK